MNEFAHHFLRSDYMPHGFCYLWNPSILWLNILSDLAIALAYFVIPLIILSVIKKSNIVKFKKILILFSAFILFCGITHLFSIWVVWHGSYGIHGLLKFCTALVSVITAITLIKLSPQLNKIPSINEINEAKQIALNEKHLRETQELFKITTDMVPTGLMVINSDLTIELANPAILNMFNYELDEIIGLPLSKLVSAKKAHHDKLMIDFFDTPEEEQYAMAGGRSVFGITKDGKQIVLEVGITIKEVHHVKKAFVHIQNINEKNRIEKINRKLEKSAKRTIDAIDVGIWEWNIANNTGWWSKQTARIMGFSEHKPYSYNAWIDSIHPADFKIVEQAIEDSILNNNDFFVEYRGRINKHEYQWLRSRGSIISHDKNNIQMVGLISNIHKEKLAQIELNEKTDFLDKIISKSLAGMYIYDLEQKKTTFINDAYKRITGYNLDDINSIENLDSLYHPEDLNKIKAHQQSIVSSRSELSEIEFRIKHKLGHWIWCYSKDVTLQKNEAGAVTSMLGSFVETTELKQKQSEILHLAADFSSIFEQAAVGIAKVSLNGKWNKVNSKLCSILGYTKKEFLETDFQTITYPPDIEKDIDKIKELIAGNYAQYQLEKRFVQKNGDIIWALLTVSIVRDSENKPLHFILVVENISERKVTELKLEDSNKALESFAYTASHDLQEPLRKIMAFSNLLNERLMDKLESTDAKFELERIHKAAYRMSHMIEGLLELSKFGSAEITKKVTKLSNIVNNCNSDLDEIILQSSAIINLNSDAQINVDFDLMVLTFRNLIKNSIKYKGLNSDPIINIDIKTINNNHVITIEDNGMGFNNKSSIEMFMPFKRLVDHSSIEGTGMGLAICKQIINKHSGTITAASNLDTGSTFTITLPK